MTKIYPAKLTEDMVKNASKITVKYDSPMYLGEGMEVYFIDFLKNVDFWKKTTSGITGTKIEPKRYIGQLSKNLKSILSWNNQKNTDYCKNVQFIVETDNTMKGCKTTARKTVKKSARKTVRRR